MVTFLIKNKSFIQKKHIFSENCIVLLIFDADSIILKRRRINNFLFLENLELFLKSIEKCSKSLFLGCKFRYFGPNLVLKCDFHKNETHFWPQFRTGGTLENPKLFFFALRATPKGSRRKIKPKTQRKWPKLLRYAHVYVHACARI